MQTNLAYPAPQHDLSTITVYIWCNSCQKAHRLSEEYYIEELDRLYKEGKVLAAVTDLENLKIHYTFFGEVETNF